MNSIFICPKCRESMELSDKTLRCNNNHSFDIAKQGYVNLILGHTSGHGDDSFMCKSRHEFHNCDYYGCLSDKIASVCAHYKFKTIIDAGCGEGYYLRKIRDFYVNNNISFNSFCGIDLAKEAIAIASKSEKNITDSNKIKYAVAGIFDMPVNDHSVDCVLSVFAPVPDKEAYRILNSDGVMIVVSPGGKHLDGLKSAIYDITYDNELSDKNYEGFELVKRDFVSDTITVSGDNIVNLFHMTPYYWKTSERDSAKLKSLDALTTKIEFVVSLYKKV